MEKSPASAPLSDQAQVLPSLRYTIVSGSRFLVSRRVGGVLYNYGPTISVHRLYRWNLRSWVILVGPPFTIGASFTLLMVMVTVADGHSVPGRQYSPDTPRVSGRDRDGVFVVCSLGPSSRSSIARGPTVIWPVAGSMA